MTQTKPIAWLCAFACGLAACSETTPASTVAVTPLQLGEVFTDVKPTTPPGICLGSAVTPAITEKATVDELVKPVEKNPDGTVRAPAIYRSVQGERVVRPAGAIWFEAPCPETMTPEFIASLQRALSARGYYRGEVQGEMTAGTLAAVKDYQSARGLDSEMLSIAAARQLGLVVY